MEGEGEGRGERDEGKGKEKQRTGEKLRSIYRKQSPLFSSLISKNFCSPNSVTIWKMFSKLQA